MKTKCTLLLALIACWLSSLAQPALPQVGEAVITHSGVSNTEINVRVMDVREPGDWYAGTNWGEQMPTGFTGIPGDARDEWTAGNLGQVFGIALNNTGPSPVIYVSTTQIYMRSSIIYAPFDINSNSFSEITNVTRNNVPLIWQLDGDLSMPSHIPLVVSTDIAELNPSDPLRPNNGMFNKGASIGNICYDAQHNQIFATNMQDGRIYRIDAATGDILSRFDPFVPYNSGQTILETGFVEMSERLWGIGYWNNTVFFATWKEDAGRPDPSVLNQIYSIPLDATGEFVATVLSGTGYHGKDYGSTSLTAIINIPTYTSNYSNPVADIELSTDGNTMMLAERTMARDFGPDFESNIGDLPVNWAHRSRILRYNKTGSSWNDPNIPYALGFHNNGANSSGGVDLGYASVEDDLCEQYVWGMGDAIQWVDNGNNTYGLMGVSAATGCTYLTSNAVADFVDVYSQTGDWWAKTMLGDVDILREACCNIQVTLEATTICSSGTIASTVTGGVAPYSYAWSNSETTPNTSGNAGTYTLTVTDAVGCTATASATILNNGITAELTFDTGVPCLALCDGAASVTVTGGTSPYTYAWSNSATTASVTGLCPGHTNLTVTDANGCSAVHGFIKPDEVVPILPIGTTVSCHDECDATLIVSAGGGVGPYTYQWSHHLPSIATLTDLCAGTYQLTVTDAANCSVTTQVMVMDRPEIVITLDYIYPANCPGTSMGIFISASGGTLNGGDFTYTWSNGATTEDIVSLPAGNYCVTVTDAIGCSATACYTIEELNPLTVSISAMQPLCNEPNSGMLTAISNVASTTYVWSNGGNGPTISNLLPGVYCVTASLVSPNGTCTVTLCDTIHPTSGPPTATLTISHDTICTAARITISLSGPDDGRVYYGQLLMEGNEGSDLIPLPFTGSPVVLDVMGTIILCARVYEDSTGRGCYGEVCDTVVIEACCDSLIGKFAITHTEDPENPTWHTFTNSNDEYEPAFVEWRINEELRFRTDGDDPYTDTLGVGDTLICARAAYIFTDDLGNAVCCYVDTCIKVPYDKCEYMRATDTVLITRDPQDFTKVTFNFVGVQTPVPVLIWQFGDGTVDAHSGNTVTHQFAYDGNPEGTHYTVCVQVAWTRMGAQWTPDNPQVCCCVDEICIDFVVGPCQLTQWDFNQNYINNALHIYANPTPAINSINNVAWFVTLNPDNPANTPTHYYTGQQLWLGLYGQQPGPAEVCMDISYNVQFPTIGTTVCRQLVCEEFDLIGAPQQQGLLRYFPNPTSNIVSVEVKAIAMADATIQIMDNMGRSVLIENYKDLQEGMTQLHVNLSTLSNGLYSMRVTVGDESKVVKVVKD